MSENDVLKKIYAAKAQHLEDEMAREPYGAIRERARASVASRRPFLAKLQEESPSALVTEIKRASPSAGLIARDFDAATIAEVYERAGADCISILTESDHFLGDIHYVSQVREVVKLPLLRKDFMTHPYQVAQAAAYGADCILLIVGGLRDEQIQACMDEAREYNLDVLMEVHDVKNLDRALEFEGVNFIGVNNRNLRTMLTDIAIGEHILPKVPRGVFAISESGVSSPADMERLHKAGAKGFLIGEALMKSDDPAALIKSLKRVYAH